VVGFHIDFGTNVNILRHLRVYGEIRSEKSPKEHTSFSAVIVTQHTQRGRRR
jgi:hypothetical protein